MKFSKTLALAAVLLLGGAGCSESEHPDTADIAIAPTSTRAQATKMRDLCEPMLNFFAEELNDTSVRINSPRDLDSTLGGSGYCHVDGKASWRGFVRAYRAPSDTDPTGGRDGFVAFPGVEGVLVSDDPPGAIIEFATRVEDWNGNFQISLNDSESAIRDFDLTGDQQKAAADFIVELVRALQSRDA
ncbi:MAG TPA: hypothetical protein VK083_04160 [Nocardia sp.]|uniref:hypothetical protein n=1 Tax=Nocardia sp. TaxID=1821 RepID=UPI002B4B8598|nr:hypothetical protein [Nocardia sp.]HLS75973.1 hypothetical protein [Nocardia sp.]